MLTLHKMLTLRVRMIRGGLDSSSQDVIGICTILPFYFISSSDSVYIIFLEGIFQFNSNDNIYIRIVAITLFIENDGECLCAKLDPLKQRKSEQQSPKQGKLSGVNPSH